MVGRPGWERFAPVGVGLLAAVVALWNLTISGYANTYYSAAAQAAAQSWSAMFYGAFDAAGFITVDKPPASLWVMGLSVRLLGLSPASILLPQALAGIAAALFLWAAVRRSFGPAAALIAGVAFALTPVAALMFRYNNPDALLTLLLVAGAWALVRGLEDDRLRWPILAAALVGFAFLTKYLQAYLVLPAFALTYLLAARGGFRRRVAGLALSALAVAVSSAWWVAIVELVPAASRPYIGGSASNSVLDLVLGYDGLGRILGQAGRGAGLGGAGGLGGFGGPGGAGFGGPGGGPGGFGGSPGWLRMFNREWAGEISWLLPAAAGGFLAGMLARLRTPRTDARRAGYVLWGTWTLVHVLVFSMMSGIAHPYYAVALAPAAAALAGGAIDELWRLRSRTVAAGIALGAMLAGTAWWGMQVLDRTPDLLPGVGLGSVCIALAAAIVLAVPPIPGDPRARLVARGALVLGLAAALVGPAVYTGATMGTSLGGGDPAAGPATGAFGGGRGAFGGGPGNGVPGTGVPGDGIPGGGIPGDAAPTGDAVVVYLLANRGGATWLAAVSSANEAGPLQLASGVPVMAMGGFMGSDPAPTLSQLQAYVRDGRLRFVLVGGGPAGGPGGFFGGDGQGSVAGQRNTWITRSCAPVEVAGSGASLYDCAGAVGP
jgi:4-amino-4-deoxy-L-arabinose transferase-like glycosyltransferase